MSLSRILFVAAAFCFFVALLLALGTLGGDSGPAWRAGGLLAVALGLAAGGATLLPVPRR